MCVTALGKTRARPYAPPVLGSDPRGLVFLIASLLALAAAPLLHRLALRSARTLAVLDGFVFVAIGGLVLGHVLPHAIEAGGLGVLLVAVLGLFGPGLLERSLEARGRQAHALALLLATLGLLFHGLVDGFALASADGATRSDVILPLAVLLHRVPEALTIWWLLRPAHGVAIASGALALVGACTLVGYHAGDALFGATVPAWLGWFQALVAGSLLHVMIHRSHPVEAGLDTRAASGWGGLAGIALLVAIAVVRFDEHGEHDGHSSFNDVFRELALDSAPALLLAFVLAGVVFAFLPAVGTAWLRRGGRVSQSLRGVAFGLPLPLCSCGVIPVYRSLVLSGVPAAAAMAFVVATPELGLDAVLLSAPLLGTSMTVARVVAAVLVAVAVGTIVGRLAARERSPAKASIAPSAKTRAATFGARVRVARDVAFGAMVDDTMPWILVGLVFAAVLEPLLGTALGDLAAMPLGLDVPLLALVGMPLYVCASGATPLVAVLIAHGASPGAAIAFLITGPATNVTTFGVLRELHGRRVALAFAATIAIAAVACGWIANAVLGRTSVVAGAVHDHAERWGAWTAVAVLGLLTARSLVRVGPREFLSQVLPDDPEGHSHEHEHGPEHGHEHGHKHPGVAKP